MQQQQYYAQPQTTTVYQPFTAPEQSHLGYTPSTPTGFNAPQTVVYTYEFADDPQTRFQPVPWRDAWCIGLFLIHFLVFLGIMGAGIYYVYDSDGTTVTKDRNDFYYIGFIDSTITWAEVGLLMASCSWNALIGGIFAVFWIFLMKTFPKFMIYLSGLIAIGLMIALGVLFIVLGFGDFGIFGFIFGGILILFGLLMCVLYFFWRKRIAFSALILTTVVKILSEQKGPFFTAIGMMGIYFVWIILWSFTAIMSQGIAQQDAYIGTAVLLFLVFSWFWTAQTIKNIVHVTTAGLVASWYFLNDISNAAAIGSFKRATTTSLGSIIFGSGIIAFAETLNFIAQSKASSSDNIWWKLVALCASCIVALIKFINKYAFTQVAIYGKPFISAAIATFKLLSHHGVDIILNDSLIGNVVVTGCMIGSLLSVLTGGILIWIAIESGADGDFTVFALLLGFFISYGLVCVLLETVDSAQCALFVCLAEDPAVLKRQSPELYHALRERYKDNVCIASNIFARVPDDHHC